jgi:hypothetical protein
MFHHAVSVYFIEDDERHRSLRAAEDMCGAAPNFIFYEIVRKRNFDIFQQHTIHQPLILFTTITTLSSTTSLLTLTFSIALSHNILCIFTDLAQVVECNIYECLAIVKCCNELTGKFCRFYVEI